MLSPRVLSRHWAAQAAVPRLQCYCTANGFRPRNARVLGALQASRYASTKQTGDGKSGHINTESNQGIFFLDNIYPLKLRWMLRLPFFDTAKAIDQALRQLNQARANNNADPLSVVQSAFPKEIPVKVAEIIPRVKEGGSFVKVDFEPTRTLQEIEATLKKSLKENPINPIFNPWRRVRAFLVQGKPWVEDLNRFPSPKVKVEFLPTAPGNEAAELSQEQLYSLLRQYGKIHDIVSQPPDSKIVPKYALVTFRLSRHAIMAKNCMHGFVLPETEGGGKNGTMLRIGYEPILKGHWIRDWLTSHPRIVFPLLLALATAITVAVFDPIRSFFIKAHITRSFHVTDNRIYKWLASQLSRANSYLSLLQKKPDDDTLDALWEDRKSYVEQIQTWLMETADTFVVIQGPRGSGKRELVMDQALKGRKNSLLIDCKPIQEARGDSATIGAAANQVGYRPVFSWMNSFSSLIDLAAQGTIGTKTGFSETLDSQLAKIFQNTTTALQEIALESRSKNDKDAELADDDYLDAHPECRPVVVIDNFLHKSNESGVVYDKISEWAAALTTANIAHVIFLTHDVSFSKSLSKALPDRVFRQLSLGDCTPQVAKQFVIKHLDADPDDAVEVNGQKVPPSQVRDDLRQLDDCIETLGGRLTDLEFLARRIKAGETPQKAIQEMIEQSASEILKMYVLDANNRSWSVQEAWYIIKALAKSETIRYNEVLLEDTFKSGGDGALQALEQAELISIVSSNGRPHSIKPGKPVYQAAFKYLVRDHVLKARMDLAILTELTKIETQSIEKYENELSLLGGLPKQPAQLNSRILYLLGKVQGSQTKIEKYELESAGLKKVLQAEY